MASRLFGQACKGGFCLLVLALLPACGKDSNPTGPVKDPNAAIYGTWIGSLTGPEVTQQSGWRATSRDSIWLVISAGSMDFHMSSATGAGHSLSVPSDTCFVRYPSALNALADPNVSFRVNFSVPLGLGFNVPFAATRNGTALTGTMMLPGDTLAGRWTATFCPTCPTSSVITSIEPDTVAAGSPEFTLLVKGSNFNTCSVVRVDDLDRFTTFVPAAHPDSASQLSIRISASEQVTAGTKTVSVFTPGPGGGTSNGLPLTITPIAAPVASIGRALAP